MESVAKNVDIPGWFSVHASIRTDSYVMLATLLGKPPSEDLLNILQNLQWDEAIREKVGEALRELRQASHEYPLTAMKNEFDRLFVGLGSGELVPYASWYRERRIQSFPLASVRSDLVRLGMTRKTESHEPEDHAGALCECMALISQETSGMSRTMQAEFFEQHIASWMKAFFKDLQSAKNAAFYRIVGLFGHSFLENEAEYLRYRVEA
jgi:TorA maturation chaperone TorD